MGTLSCLHHTAIFRRQIRTDSTLFPRPVQLLRRRIFCSRFEIVEWSCRFLTRIPHQKLTGQSRRGLAPLKSKTANLSASAGKIHAECADFSHGTCANSTGSTATEFPRWKRVVKGKEEMDAFFHNTATPVHRLRLGIAAWLHSVEWD